MSCADSCLILGTPRSEVLHSWNDAAAIYVDKDVAWTLNLINERSGCLSYIIL